MRGDWQLEDAMSDRAGQTWNPERYAAQVRFVSDLVSCL